MDGTGICRALTGKMPVPPWQRLSDTAEQSRVHHNRCGQAVKTQCARAMQRTTPEEVSRKRHSCERLPRGPTIEVSGQAERCQSVAGTHGRKLATGFCAIEVDSSASCTSGHITNYRGLVPAMSELHDECGVAAIYHLPGRGSQPAVSRAGARGSLAADAADAAGHPEPRPAGGRHDHVTTPHRNQLIDTYKDVGGVSEVFRLSHRGKYESLMREYAGRAAIGHVRYATCGPDDRSYAQPFERHHMQEAQVVQLRLQRPVGQLPGAARGAAGRRRQLPRPRDRHRNHHARDRPRAVGRPAGRR